MVDHDTQHKEEFLLTMKDIHVIMDYANYQYHYASLPMRISKEEIAPKQVPNIVMIEAIVTQLNKMNLLTKLVKIDYTK